ncbi:hypothetical protein BVRB_1g023000 [Beta vulgaris subsp. vulgaris]|uniref:Uncharacterized protein n=1 Tax=Beta vulgaris subsp. vulgaris TaxID=3555 RepID=A0A0J8BDX7_BETVV|nr:hypothetical protein BVRB_1g023000 [Beta vulgaris subsp. vulgaris]
MRKLSSDQDLFQDIGIKLHSCAAIACWMLLRLLDVAAVVGLLLVVAVVAGSLLINSTI